MNQWQWKTPKYKNSPTEVDGYRFDSKAEADYYCELRLLKEYGHVDHFDIHPSFKLSPELTYKSDFMVYYKDGHIEVVDIKGMETEVFKIKRKFFDAHHPLAPLKVLKRKGKGWIDQ